MFGRRVGFKQGWDSRNIIVICTSTSSSRNTEGDNTETNPPTADGTATQTSRPSMTARSQGAIVLRENDSDLFGDPEDEALHELLGPTPEPNQPLHPAVEQLRRHAITDPATI